MTWLLLLNQSLAFTSSVSHNPSKRNEVDHQKCSTTARTTGMSYVIDEIKSSHQDSSSATQVPSVTTPTTLSPWSSSGVAPYKQNSHSNQTITTSRVIPAATEIIFNTTYVTKTISCSPLVRTSSLSANPPWPASPSTSQWTTPLFAGSGHRTIHADPFVWLLLGMVYIGMI